MERVVAGRKKIGISRGVLLVLLMVCAMSSSCGRKSSSVEGKLVDWNNEPVAGVKITASQIQPIKNHEQVETVTGADGSFTLKGLFPSSAYVLKPSSDKWVTKAEAKVDSGAQGEMVALPQPLQILIAFATRGGGKVLDLASGAVRFEVSSDGVITDSQTKLEWVVGPDQDTSYTQATQWVDACKVAGGGWRMPTRAELQSLYQKGVGERNMDPVIKVTGWGLWAEPKDEKTAWGFDFSVGNEDWGMREGAGNGRVIGVRSRP